MEMVIFLLFAALTLGSAVVVVTHKNPVYSTMSLVLTLFSLAMLFVTLGAPFIGVLQILIYTGAILVLFLFVIMLLNVQRTGGDSRVAGQGLQIFGGLIGAVLFALLVALALWRAGRPALKPLTADLVSLAAFSHELFTEYLLPFEIVGLLLLAAVIGATVAARRPPPSDTTPGLAPSGFESGGDSRLGPAEGSEP